MRAIRVPPTASDLLRELTDGAPGQDRRADPPGCSRNQPRPLGHQSPCDTGFLKAPSQTVLSILLVAARARPILEARPFDDAVRRPIRIAKC